MSESWIQCSRCGRKLAKNKNGVIEIIHGKKEARIYGAVAVVLICDRCGASVDLPHKMPVAADSQVLRKSRL
mgnify:CR=1 FL=1